MWVYGAIYLNSWKQGISKTTRIDTVKTPNSIGVFTEFHVHKKKQQAYFQLLRIEIRGQKQKK